MENKINNDIKFMKLALRLSRKAVGFTEPNPLVGAVAVKDGTIVGTGFHRKFGAAHAEREALADVPPGSTLYVTLEPCDHYGKTPPCTEFIIEKNVHRVVTAMYDPNPVVNGKGIKFLEEQGVFVDVGLMEETARSINRHYIRYITGKRPYVALRAGVSLDGKLTDKFRGSQWVTPPELRRFSHSFRGEFSAIMAGISTVRDDNPSLNIRESNWTGKNLFRVILDSQNSLDPDAGLKLFTEQDRFPLVLFSSKKAENQTPRCDRHYFVNPASSGGLNLTDVLMKLHSLGIASVMVEGGGALIDSFLKEDLYDEITLFQAGTLLGGRESVQLFASGTRVSQPLAFKDIQMTRFSNGNIVRAFKEICD